MSNSANNSLPQKRPGSSRWKNGKAATALALAAGLTLLSLTGCGDSSLSAGGSGIKSPVVINYLVNNPLTIQEHREGNREGFDCLYLTVDGLKDGEIEQAINDRIKEVYDGLRVQDLPPYRGIKKNISEDAELVQEQVQASVTGNFNNILSVTFYKFATYRNPVPPALLEGNEKDTYEYTKSFSEEETLNFDLNTGKEISLKDLFCDDVDYMKLINDYISRFLAESHSDEEDWYVGVYSGVKQVEPFKGLSEDQIFSISPNGIGFVFDYRTPQFDTESMAANRISNFWEFGDKIAIAKRFYKEGENIYTSAAPPVKSLVYKENRNDVGGNDYYQEGAVYVGRNWGWSSALPEEIKTRLEAMNKLDQEAVNKLKDYYRGLSEEEIKETGGGYYQLSVSGYRVGSFINIYKNVNTYTPQLGEETAEYHCYDGETLKELALVDLFKEGYDYKPVVMEAIRKAVEDYDKNSGAAGKTYSEEQYEAVYEKIDGFRLDTDGVNIHIVHPEQGSQAYGLYLYIPYADFGCENMTIFR